jgi:hypothetical protein
MAVMPTCSDMPRRLVVHVRGVADGRLAQSPSARRSQRAPDEAFSRGQHKTYGLCHTAVTFHGCKFHERSFSRERRACVRRPHTMYCHGCGAGPSRRPQTSRGECARTQRTLSAALTSAGARPASSRRQWHRRPLSDPCWQMGAWESLLAVCAYDMLARSLYLSGASARNVTRARPLAKNTNECCPSYKLFAGRRIRIPARQTTCAGHRRV